MKKVECEFEAETLSAVLQGRWPARAPEELRAHVAGCELCRDVTAIAGAIEEARQESRQMAAVPDAGRVWWLAQLRARRDAVEAASRPITAAQVVAFGCVVGLLGVFIGATSGWVQGLVSQMFAGSWPASVNAHHVLLLLAGAAALIAIPALVWAALARD